MLFSGASQDVVDKGEKFTLQAKQSDVPPLSEPQPSKNIQIRLWKRDEDVGIALVEFARNDSSKEKDLPFRKH